MKSWGKIVCQLQHVQWNFIITGTNKGGVARAKQRATTSGPNTTKISIVGSIFVNIASINHICHYWKTLFTQKQSICKCAMHKIHVRNIFQVLIPIQAETSEVEIHSNCCEKETRRISSRRISVAKCQTRQHVIQRIHWNYDHKPYFARWPRMRCSDQWVYMSRPDWLVLRCSATCAGK